jgi:hypothetical protein
MTGARFVCVVIALWALPAIARHGTVKFATARELYLDAGSADGLAPGATLQLRRNDRPAGSCRVDKVSEHHASCAGHGSAGDTFELAPQPSAAKAPPAPRPPPPLPPRVVAALRRALDDAPFEKVAFAGAPKVSGAALRGRTEVRIAHATFASTDVGPWHQERLDARIDGAAAFGGLALWADLSARRWTRRSETIVARPDDPTQLYVWEAALSRRSGPGSLALALGRLRPWSAPGATIVDGAQVGWVTRGGGEAGVFGGIVPDQITLAPSLSRGTVGTYLRFERRGEAGSLVRLAREETRLAFTSSPELGQRAEAELLGQLWLVRELSASANVRFAVGDRSSPNNLDALRIDLGGRLLPRLSVSGGFRYEAVSVPERDGPGATGLGGASRHADFSAAWEAADWLSLSALSGLSRDVVTAVHREYVGPELALPRLFGSLGGLSLGYVQEGGSIGGNNAWAQFVAHARAFQLLARLSWFRTRGLNPDFDDELGAYVNLAAQLGQHLSLRVAALGRMSGVGGGSPVAKTAVRGGTLEVSLGGVF